MNTRVEDILGRADEEGVRNLEVMRGAIDMTDAPVLMHEPDGRLLHLNTAICDLLGYSASQLEDLAPFGWIGPESKGGAAGRLEAILHDGGLDFASTAVRSDGSIIATVVSARRINTDQGPVVVAVIEDGSRTASR